MIKELYIHAYWLIDSGVNFLLEFYGERIFGIYDIIPSNIRKFFTLIACLPNESRKLLYENGIFIPTPTTKTPLLDYAPFCRFISIDEINLMITLQKLDIFKRHRIDIFKFILKISFQYLILTSF